MIAGFPVKHRVEALRLRVRRGRPARAASTSRRRARSASREGPDFGRLQRGETVNGVTPEQVVGEDRPGRRIVYTGDTAPVQTVEVYAHQRRRARPRGDVLRGRARPRARDRPLDRPPGRRSSRSDAGVKLLALTHLSTRYFPREIRDEARAVFENTVVPRDFDAIEVPFPERGEPQLVKAELEPSVVLTPLLELTRKSL